MKAFVQELKRRRVYRVALAYVIAGSAMIQVAGTIFPTFHSPEWTQQVLVILIALGFPFALVLAWAFEVRNGVIRRTHLSRGTRAAANNRRMWILAGAGLLVALLAVRISWPARSRIVSDEVRTPGTPTPHEPGISEKSIAVLPFDNLSDEKESVYFTDGVQDAILTDLAKVAELKVISRTSVMQYKTGVSRNLREVARQLGVANIVEGSVQRTSGWVRVNVQLIDARTDTQLWAERYDREIADIFRMQSELAQQIVAHLKAKLSPGEKAAIEIGPTQDVLAYGLYVRAKNFGATIGITARVEENLLEAVRLLNEAIARDPAFFLAYCELARRHDQLYFLGYDHTAQRLAAAESAIETAARLCPDCGEAHLARAHHFYCGFLDYDRARQELSIAQRTLPNEPLIFELHSFMDRRQNRWQISADQMERALALDPRNIFLLQQTSLTYQNMRRFADMAAVLDRALALAPRDVYTRVLRAYVELEWRADTKPLHDVIEAVMQESPAAGGDIAQAWLYLALCERDPAAAKRALTAMTAGGCREEGVAFPHGWCEGEAARARGDKKGATAAFRNARAEIGRILQQQPDYAQALAVAGTIDAALGRTEDAIHEARRAVELLPATKDSINGTLLIQYLAVVYAWTGKNDLALEQLELLARMPSWTSYGRLRLHPAWDSLRGDPRFENLVASLAPADKQP